MAVLAIIAFDHHHADPEKDKRGPYKQGHIVESKQDDEHWGIDEHPLTTRHNPVRLWLLHVPGLDANTIREYERPEIVESKLFDSRGGRIREFRKRRKFQIIIERLPVPVKQALRSKGMARINWAALKPHIQVPG